MYPLTEFSESKLRLMADMIQSRLGFEERCAQLNKQLPIADHIDMAVIESVDAKYSATITDLKEMNVWVLTALQMVASEQTIQQS